MEDETKEVLGEGTGGTEAAGESNEGGTPAPPATVAELQATVEKLLAEKNELTDGLLRKHAELENFRKRTQREREQYVQYATEDLIQALLPTLDAFDRALAHCNEGVPKQFYQGLELIRKELMDVLGRAGLAHFEAVGKTFDPHLHQAVEMVEAGPHRDQEIVEEMQRGYMLKKRLLRPANVKVAVVRPKDGPADPGDPQ